MGVGSIPQLFLVDADGKLETLIPEYLARAKTASHGR